MFILKSIYYEKATKFREISTLLLSYVVPVKSNVEISQNFVAFSEYMNFMNIDKSFSSCSNSYYFNFQWKFIPLVRILRSWRHTPHSHNGFNLITKINLYFYAPALIFLNFCITIHSTYYVYVFDVH